MVGVAQDDGCAQFGQVPRGERLHRAGRAYGHEGRGGDLVAVEMQSPGSGTLIGRLEGEIGLSGIGRR